MSSRTRLRALTALCLAAAMLAGPVAQASAMSRDLVMQRANTWIAQTIKYDQGGWADLSGAIVNSPSAGWRRDCSGFVSMCWNLPRPGATTRTLQNHAYLISKESLRPGDALVSYDNHAVIFGGWVDSTRTQYYCYEMSSSASGSTGDGTVVRITPYPYWNKAETWKPYRLKTIDGSLDIASLVDQVGGSSRYGTAIAASKTAFKDGGAQTVVVASGANWPDALGASALAGAVGGPVLLTRPDSLPPEVTDEIRRLDAKEAIIVGAEAAVSAGVADQLGKIPGLAVTRIGGPDRYETSRLIATETAARVRAAGRTPDPAVFVTTGTNFPDALAASPLAYAKARPIVLTKPDGMSPQVASTISATGARNAVMLGSTSAVSESVETSISAVVSGAVSRLAGYDRYATARAIVAYSRSNGLSYSGAAIATGEDFPDALAGGAMAGRLGAVLMLTPSSKLDPGIAELMIADPKAFGKPHVLGGEGALKPIVLEAIALALGAS